MISFYKDKNDKWRWRIKAANGEILAASSQGFVRRIDARANLIKVGNACHKWEEASA